MGGAYGKRREVGEYKKDELLSEGMICLLPLYILTWQIYNRTLVPGMYIIYNIFTSRVEKRQRDISRP